MDVHGHVLLIVAGFLLGRSSGAAQVRDDDGVMLARAKGMSGRHIWLVWV